MNIVILSLFRIKNKHNLEKNRFRALKRRKTAAERRNSGTPFD